MSSEEYNSVIGVSKVPNAVHPLDLVDLQYPDTESAAQRSVVRKHKNAQLSQWPLTKRAATAIYCAAILLPYHAARFSNDPEVELYKRGTDSSSVLLSNGRYKTCNLAELCAVHDSSVTITKKELCLDVYGKSAQHWMQQGLLHICKVEVSLEQAEIILREAFAIKTLANTLPQLSRQIFQNEMYIVGANNLLISEGASVKHEEFVNNSKRGWFDANSDPFAEFHFTRSMADLDRIPREACQNCSNGKVHLYCSNCRTLTETTKSMFKNVNLPIDIHVVHHPQEKITKSTGLQTCVMSTQGRFIEFPHEVPVYNPDETILLFPTEDAVDMWDESLDMSRIKQAVIVESTWQKAGSVLAHPNLVNLKKVRLIQRESTFWRHQELGAQFLSTVEAIYYLCVEAFERQKADQVPSPVDAVPITYTKERHPTNMDAVVVRSTGQIGNINKKAVLQIDQLQRPAQMNYKGQFDDLLVLYAHQHHKVHINYASGQRSAPKVWRSTHLEKTADQ